MSDEYDPMQVADEFLKVVEVWSGVKSALIANGFNEEQAGDMVVAMMQQSAADMWATAGKAWRGWL